MNGGDSKKIHSFFYPQEARLLSEHHGDKKKHCKKKKIIIESRDRQWNKEEKNKVKAKNKFKFPESSIKTKHLAMTM